MLAAIIVIATVALNKVLPQVAEQLTLVTEQPSEPVTEHLKVTSLSCLLVMIL